MGGRCDSADFFWSGKECFFGQGPTLVQFIHLIRPVFGSIDPRPTVTVYVTSPIFQGNLRNHSEHRLNRRFAEFLEDYGSR
jgi:hypothetical protein